MGRKYFRMLIGGVLAVSAVFFGYAVPQAHAEVAEQSVNYSDINAGSDAITAQGIIFAGICEKSVAEQGGVDTCACRDQGNCTLDDALQVFANIAVFILGISGSAVLFVFVYGGYKWLFSRGDSKWVQAGKDTMTGAVIGLMIIFGAYVAMNFIISGLTTKSGTPASKVLEETVNQGLSDEDQTKAVEGVFTTDPE